MTIPQPSWFCLQPPSDLHGLGHTARVMTWACVLTRESPWREVVLWAAACHDLRRHDDGGDPQHGFRAGAWVREQLPSVLRTAPAELELIARACDWHVCSDRLARWDHPTLWLLKDADGLDRARLYDLDPSYLRHPGSLPWVDAARRLYEATADLQEPTRICEIAVGMGLPVSDLLEWTTQQRANLIEPSAATDACA